MSKKKGHKWVWWTAIPLTLLAVYMTDVGQEYYKRAKLWAFGPTSPYGQMLDVVEFDDDQHKSIYGEGKGRVAQMICRYGEDIDGDDIPDEMCAIKLPEIELEDIGKIMQALQKNKWAVLKKPHSGIGPRPDYLKRSGGLSGNPVVLEKTDEGYIVHVSDSNYVDFVDRSEYDVKGHETKGRGSITPHGITEPESNRMKNLPPMGEQIPDPQWI